MADDDLVVKNIFTLKKDAPSAIDSAGMVTFEVLSSTGRDVLLTVFDMLGRRIRTLVDDYLLPGVYSYTWNGTDNEGRSVENGTYVYRLEIDGHVATRSITLLRDKK